MRSETNPPSFLCTGREAGLAMLEFVIAISVFIVLLTGIFDYSLAIREHAVMVDAVRTAARVVALKSSEQTSSYTSSAPATLATAAAWKSAYLDLADQTVKAYMEGAGYKRTDYTTTLLFSIPSPGPGGTELATVRVNIQRATPRARYFSSSTITSCVASEYKLHRALRADTGTPPC